VGEIGIPRHEFLYELTWWEINSIIRGYRKRNRLTHQLLAEIVYTTTYAMRDPKGKTVEDMFPMLFEDDDDYDEPPISAEEVAELQAEMDAINSQTDEKETE
jgi:hypothetical protein